MSEPIPFEIYGVKGRIFIEHDGIDIEFDGYGSHSVEGSAPVYIDCFHRRPRVLIFGDINQEDPTHVIELQGARSECYKEPADG